MQNITGISLHLLKLFLPVFINKVWTHKFYIILGTHDVVDNDVD